jgi:hypothetical protein
MHSSRLPCSHICEPHAKITKRHFGWLSTFSQFTSCAHWVEKKHAYVCHQVLQCNLKNVGMLALLEAQEWPTVIKPPAINLYRREVQLPSVYRRKAPVGHPWLV